MMEDVSRFVSNWFIRILILIHHCIYVCKHDYINNNSVSFRCLQLNFLDQNFCGDASLATDLYIYGYTGYENFTALNNFAKQIEPFIDWSQFCVRFAVSYFCNLIFIPCDLTTGRPMAACTNSCHFLRTYCPVIYFQVVQFGTAAGYLIVDNCENTLILLQQHFGFPCSSSSLQNNCIDFLGTHVNLHF